MMDHFKAKLQLCDILRSKRQKIGTRGKSGALMKVSSEQIAFAEHGHFFSWQQLETLVRRLAQRTEIDENTLSQIKYLMKAVFPHEQRKFDAHRWKLNRIRQGRNYNKSHRR